MRFVRFTVAAVVLGVGLFHVGPRPAVAAPATFSVAAVMSTDPMWAPANWWCLACPETRGQGSWIMTSWATTGEQEPVGGLRWVDSDGTWEGWCGLASFDGTLWYGGADVFSVHFDWVGTTLVMTGASESRTLNGVAQIAPIYEPSLRPTGCTLEPATNFRVTGQVTLTDS